MDQETARQPPARFDLINPFNLIVWVVQVNDFYEVIVILSFINQSSQPIRYCSNHMNSDEMVPP